ncbi:MAG: cellulase family glycosylhydrolase [Silvibacterium sp.]|nr:cellulase family glycosylhydrolase [Silvibacterium sp.]
MKPFRSFVFVALCLPFLCLSAHASSNGFVHTQGPHLVDGQGRTLHLRGTSLGNWIVREGYMFHLDKGPQSSREIDDLTNELLGPAASAQLWREYRDRYITRADIQFLARVGYNSIRIPIDYRFFTPGNDEGFTLLDRVVGWSQEAGLYVIIDLHAAPGGQTGTNIDNSWGYPWLWESPECQQETVDIWKRIAAHYRDSTTVLGYDLLNEPIPHFPALQIYNSRLEPLYRRIVSGIREVDTHHVVILGGAQWDTNLSVFGPPFDSNVVYTFHKYWMPPEQAAVQAYVDFRDRYHVPIWLGESGENNDAWVSQFRQLLETHDIDWCFWPYKKMDSGSAPVTFKRPRYWDEIMAFAQTRAGLGDAEKQIARRPPMDHIRAAFDDLLENIRFENCVHNDTYLKALGLTPTT